MTDNRPFQPTNDDVEDAFEALRREVSLTRLAVEGLTAARERIPDYSMSLGSIAGAIKDARTALARIEDSPAMKLTPAIIAADLAKGSVSVRIEDARLLSEARDTLSRSIGHVDAIVKRGQSADGQRHERLWWGAAGALAGILLWSVLPGAVARALPASWHVPEWMAARTLGTGRRPSLEARLDSTARSVSERRSRRSSVPAP
jgi:hypothetical protein